MNKKLIRLTESDLHKIVKKSVNKVLKEEIGTGEFPNPDALVNTTHNRVEQALLNAEKYEKIILGIEDYLNRRIKVEPLGDVRKAFIEIRNQLQVIK